MCRIATTAAAASKLGTTHCVKSTISIETQSFVRCEFDNVLSNDAWLIPTHTRTHTRLAKTRWYARPYSRQPQKKFHQPFSLSSSNPLHTKDVSIGLLWMDKNTVEHTAEDCNVPRSVCVLSTRSILKIYSIQRTHLTPSVRNFTSNWHRHWCSGAGATWLLYALHRAPPSRHINFNIHSMHIGSKMADTHTHTCATCLTSRHPRSPSSFRTKHTRIRTSIVILYLFDRCLVALIFLFDIFTWHKRIEWQRQLPRRYNILIEYVWQPNITYFISIVRSACGGCDAWKSLRRNCLEDTIYRKMTIVWFQIRRILAKF